MFGVFTEGFARFAPTKSARNWSEQIIRTLGLRDGAATASDVEADDSAAAAPIVAAEASAAFRINARREVEEDFCSFIKGSCSAGR
jgi:hypothetical protein